MRVLTLSICALLLSTLAVGCGDDESSSFEERLAAAQKEAAENAPGPDVRVPDRPLPKKLVVKELRKGTGRVARVGDEVNVRYVGRRWDGQSYSNTWYWDKAPRYTIGGHEINPGLDLTLRGMREGGRREVIIPLHLLYYPEERHGPLSAENAEVVIIDLFRVRKGSSRGS